MSCGSRSRPNGRVASACANHSSPPVSDRITCRSPSVNVQPTLSWLARIRYRGLRENEGGTQFHSHVAVPQLHGRFLNVAPRHVSRIVDQNVEPAEDFHGVLDERTALGDIGKVRAVEGKLLARHTCRGDLVDDPRASFGIATAD